MPGFVLEEPFPLARFHSTVNDTDSKHFVVGLKSLETSMSGETVDRVDDSDFVAITIQGEGFKVYNTTDQKCTKSWITPPGIAFVGPATHIDGGRDSDAVDYTYAVVASGPDVAKSEERKLVWLWKNSKNGNNEEIDKTVKKFDEHIDSIHVSPALHSHVIIVNESGSIELATKDLDRLTAKQKAQENCRVIWSNVFVTSNAHTRPCYVPSSMVPSMSTIVVTVCHMSADMYSIKLNYVNVERRSIDLLTSIDIKLEKEPVAFTLDPTDGRFTLLDASGKWTIYRMQLKHTSSKKISGFLSEHLSIQLNGYCFQDDVLGNVASLSPLSDSYVALVAARKSKKGVEVEHVVSVWDVKYGTLQAEQLIKMNEKNTFNKSTCIYSVSVLPNSHLAITMSSITTKAASSKSKKSTKKLVDADSAVMLCPYYSEPVSLMAAMGKMKQTVDFMGINNDFRSDENVGYSRSGMETVLREPNFDVKEEPASVYNTWVSKLEKCQKNETKTLARLMNPDVTADEFTKIFFNYVQVNEITDDVSMAEAASDPIFDQTEQYRHTLQTKFGHTKKSELSQFFISTITNKCFENADFWPVEVVLYLMSRSLLRSHYSEKGIIRPLLERKEWGLIPLLLENVQDIPEKDLVTLIKALTTLYKEDESWKERFSTYLRLVVDAPKNDIFLQQTLKRIDATELAIILETIVSWLSDKASNLNKRSNIVEFTNNILDIHYPSIILEPTLQAIANTLRELTKTEIEVVDDLEQLRNILGAYDRKHKHSKAKRIENKKKQNDGPMDELTRLRQKNKGKFGGEQGIPVYRVEVFRF